MQIGLLGADSTSENLGVQALAYSQMHVIEDICRKLRLEHSYMVLSFGQKESAADRLRRDLNITDAVAIDTVDISFRNAVNRKKMSDALRSCDLVFGITGGDSFSDIYGMRRFASNMGCYLMLGSERVPYILAPQTYGPFSRRITAALASKVLTRARAVYARDEKSGKLAQRLGVKNIEVVTDVAFFLPYENSKGMLKNGKTGKRLVGINVSGLLWRGGYTGRNEFGLKADYKTFIRELLGSLSKRDDLSVQLISHVVTNEAASPENDYEACRELAEEFSSVSVVEPFDNPIEAKSYISGFDCFLGSRMHATIASFSSGVPTLPIAYSKKFNGLYGSLGYSATLDLRSADTDQATSEALRFVDSYSGVKMQHEHALQLVHDLKQDYSRSIESIIRTFGDAK